MAYRYRGKYFQVDPDDPRAEGICDRCGRRYNLYRLVWQFAYQGNVTPQNTRLLVCTTNCLDPLNPQDQPVILSPDPEPLGVVRPENYVLDETSWMTTQSEQIITTQDGDPFITPLPNPGDAANTTNLYCTIRQPSASLDTLYLDLFNGNPASGGSSVLAVITGSAVRTDIADELVTVNSLARNVRAIVIATASESQTNISHAGLYNAASGGTLLMSGAVSVSQTIALGNPVQFAALGLSINVAV